MKVYGISGLGADSRVFEKLDIGNEIIPLEWITPISGESLKDYALRFSASIDSSTPFCLIGVSFGGMIATEISKHLNPDLTVLISSIKTKSELPFIYRMIGKSGLLSLIPKQLLIPPNWLADIFFQPHHPTLLHQILDDTDPNFAKWALQSILGWENEQVKNRIITISGSSDRILPSKKADFIIHGGGHFMIVDRADEISKIIQHEIYTHNNNN